MLQSASFVSSYDRFAMAPLLLVIAADLGVSLGAAAAAASVYYLAYGLMQPVWGTLSERIGRVRTMRLGLAVGVPAGIASAVAPDLITLTLTRGVVGGCFSAVIPAALVYVGDSWPAHVRQRPLSDVLAATALGTAGGTVGAGLIADVTTWRLALAASAVAGGAQWIALRRLPEPAGQRTADRPRHLLARVLARPWAVAVLVLAFAEGIAMVGMFVYLAPALQSAGATVGVAGVVVSLFGVGVLASSWLVKALVGRLPPAGLAAIGGVLIMLGWAVVSVEVGLATVLAACALLGAGWAFFHSTLQGWATDVVPTARATAVSLFVAALFVGGAVGTALAAPLADAGAFVPMFRIALVLALPVTVAVVWGQSRYERARSAERR
ncbi:MFS transporter [Pseudonocardia saturnea]